MNHEQQHALSLQDPVQFWGEQAALVDWHRPPTIVLDDSQAPFCHWYADGELNTCHNAVDRHVANGAGERTALVYDSPVTGHVRRYTYAELLDEVNRLAWVLRERGVEKGDRVLIYLPMIPEAVIGMLAVARLGAIHSVVFGGFAAEELAVRIDDAQPKVVLTASCGVEPTRIIEYHPIVEEALRIASHEPAGCLVKQRPEARAVLVDGRDVDWDETVMRASGATVECVPVSATDPLYILYTSGTTGSPKGIVRDNGGHAVAMAWSLPEIFGVGPGETMWAASDVGWVVGHSYIVYSPLIVGATTVLYEGKPVGTPDAGAFWRVVQDHRVKTLFTAPTAARAIRKQDPHGLLLDSYDISSLESLFVAGERLDPDTYTWLSNTLKRPVLDNWWQTETGWPIAASRRGDIVTEPKVGSSGRMMPGYDVVILGPDHEPVPTGDAGDVCIRLPLPPGCLPTIWGNDERYLSGYLSQHPGFYLTGDGGYLDEDGYLYVMGRTDDVINVAGHRLTTGRIEEVVAAHEAIAECAVVGTADELKGQMPVVLFVRKDGATMSESDIAAAVIAKIREAIGAIATPGAVTEVAALPKTRSGKILRRTMREIADGKTPQVPSTIEDRTVLDAITPALLRATS